LHRSNLINENLLDPYKYAINHKKTLPHSSEGRAPHATSLHFQAIHPLIDPPKMLLLGNSGIFELDPDVARYFRAGSTMCVFLSFATAVDRTNFIHDPLFLGGFRIKVRCPGRTAA
jgi:hypothetical protein